MSILVKLNTHDELFNFILKDYFIIYIIHKLYDMSFEQRQWDETRQQYFYLKEYTQQRTFTYVDGTVERKPYRNYKKVWCNNNPVPTRRGPKMQITDSARREIIGLRNEGKLPHEIIRATSHRKALVMRVLTEEFLARINNDNLPEEVEDINEINANGEVAATDVTV